MAIKFKKIAAAALSLIGITALSVGVSGCLAKSADLTVPENIVITKVAPPEDGSFPTAHSCAENLSYINYVFDSQTKYHSYSEGVTNAAIATQTTRTFRDYDNGVLVTTDLTYSSMIKNSTQTCTVANDGVSEVYFRVGEAPSSNEVFPTQLAWNEQAPTYFSERAYNYTYGLLPTELFNYIVNDQTILTGGTVDPTLSVESDGTYKQTFYLDPDVSTYFYQFGMKTRGGLSSYPEFSLIKFTVHFDGGWRILDSEMDEVSTVNKGVVVESKSKFFTYYYYDGDNFDAGHYGYYDSYYSKYLGDSTLEEGGSSVGEDAAPDVTNTLSNGFAKVLGGGEQFEVSARLGNNTYIGYVFLGLDLDNIAESINVKLSLGRSLKSQNLYAEYANGDLQVYYGKDFAISANIAEVKLAAEQFKGLIDGIVNAVSGKGGNKSAYGIQLYNDGNEEESDPLADLLASIEIEQSENQIVLVLNSDDLLGLGIGIDARLIFGVDGSTIVFRGATIGGLSIKGEKIDLALNLSTTTAPVISRSATNTDANLADYVADVYSLLSADLLRIDLGVHGDDENVKIAGLKGITADVTAFADLDGITVGAEAKVAYAHGGSKISATLQVVYDYNAGIGGYGSAVLYLKELNGNPVNLKLSCDIKELADAISTVLTFSGADSSMDTGKLVNMLNGALSSDFSSLISEMYADKTQIKIGVNVDTVLNMVGIDAGVPFGNCTLAYKMAGVNSKKQFTAALPAIGFSLKLTGASGEIERIDTSDCLDLSYVVDDVLGLMGSDLLKVNLSLNGSAEGVTVKELNGLSADIDLLVDLDGIAVGADVAVGYEYNEAEISAKLSVWYDNAQGKAALYLSEVCGAPVSVKLYCNIEEIADGITAILDYVGVKTDASAGIGDISFNLDGVLESVLCADLSSLLPEISTLKGGLKLAVNVDGVLSLLGAELPIQIGNVNLAYSHGEDSLLVATAPAFGLRVSLGGAEGKVQIPQTDEYLDLAYVAGDVLSILKADLLKLNLSINGDEEGVSVKQLKGVNAQLGAYLNAQGKAVVLDAALSYKSGESVISADLSVWYDFNAEGSGKLALAINSINGVDVSAKVYCDIDKTVTAVKSLLDYINVQFDPFASSDKEQQSNGLGDIIVNLLNADFAELLGEITTSSNSLKLALNTDKLLEVLGVDVAIRFGNLNLTYKHGEDDLLFANLPALGISLTLGGAEGEIKAMPEEQDCFNLEKLVQTVQVVWEQVNGIIDEQRVSFKIAKGNTHLSLDGIDVEVWGEGEVSWANDAYVALNLGMAITERGKESDEAFVKVLYDKAADENTPFIRLAINEVGLDIYKDDIEGVKNGFKDIYNKVMSLLGGESENEEEEQTQTEAQTGEEGAATLSLNSSAITSNDSLMASVFKLLASGDWVNVLNKLTVKCDGKSVMLSTLTENANSIKITADNGIKLFYEGAFGEYDERMAGPRFSLGGDLVVTSVAGSIVEDLNEQFAAINMANSKKQGSASFLRLAYDFLFEGISCMSVENILGSDTYSVLFNLNGDNCGAEALKNIYIDAQIYVTGEKGEQGKLAEGYLNVDAAGVVIKLHVITERVNGNTRFYINLSQVMDVVLPDLKFIATQSSLYETIDGIINIVNNTNLLSLVAKLLPDSGNGGNGGEEAAKPAASEGGAALTEEQVSTVTGLIEKLLNFNFSEAVVATAQNGNYTNDGVLDVTVRLDNIFKQLGLGDVGTLGEIRAVINHNDHSMTTSGRADVTDAEGNTENKEWIALTSALTERRDYSSFDKSKYISIEFLPDLLSDLVKFATNDKVDEEGNTVHEVYDMFTLSGSINASIVSMFDLKIDIATLTVSIGEDGLWFSGVLHVNRLSVLLVTIPESTVGITYSDGYLTLVKNLDSNPEYKVVTMEYFLDHMLTEKGSLIEWWLSVDGWKTLLGIINKAAGEINISSGLTTTEDVYLYKATSHSEETEISMYDFVDCLRVIIGGTETAVFGNYSDLQSKLGVNDNYYGFALNAGKITNDVLTKLYAAITRDDATGINGVKAYGAIQSYVTFSLNLSYEEGLTADNAYKVGNALPKGGVSAPNFFNQAKKLAADAEVEIDFSHNQKKSGYDEVFGCFSTADMSHDYSHMLYTHVLTIARLDGTKEVRSVRHGSTVYLYDNNSPLYTDSSKSFRKLYSTSADEVSGTTAVMNGDMTVYEISRASVAVIIHSGEQQYTVSSFVGDEVPMGVSGLETVGDVYYDADMLNKVNAGDKVANVNVLNVYGIFVNSEVVINYVTYRFTYDASKPTKGYYTAVRRGAGFNDYYCTSGNTLILENEIDGYPVVAIAANAFANTERHAIKSVIVPSNIVTVGEGAFADNVGLEKAVFLADLVTFECGSKKDDNDSRNQPFYGCSSSEGGKSTNLEIYVNNFICGGSTTNTIWTKFRVDGSAIVNRYYVGNKPSNENGYGKNGGGRLYTNGNWDYVSVAVNGEDVVEETNLTALVNANLAQGIKVGAFTQSDASTLENAITALLAAYKNASGEAKYIVNVSTSKAKTGGTLVTVTVSLNVPAQVSVYSRISFNYSLGESVTAVSANTVSTINVVKAGDDVILYSPTASQSGSYVFLGWAKTIDGALTFISSQTVYDAECVYYAVWGQSKVGTPITAEVNVSGTQISAPTFVSTDALIDGKWYDSSWNEVTTLSEDNLVVYSRSYFTFEYGVSGSGTRLDDALAGKSDAYELNYENSFIVLEGQHVSFERSSDGYTLTIKVDGNSVNSLYLREFKVGFIKLHYNWKTDNNYSEVVVSGNSSRTFKY